MKVSIDERELTARIMLNWQRLSDSFYQLDNVFQPDTYQWFGDIEGRALLAYVSHELIHGVRHPAMDEMVRIMPEKMNAKGYFGPVREELIHEQQLSGHSWLLRGLCAYARAYGSEQAREMADTVFEELYLPIAADYDNYPTDRSAEARKKGGEVGENTQIIGRWLLSTDIGCAFMSLDGLSAYYELTGREDVLALVRHMTEIFLRIDKEAVGLQTHCTLTAGRGMMRLYALTHDQFYLDGAASILALYRKSGMTYTYQNLNWWGRPDSWTEPCAIIDSLMLALALYHATGQEDYRHFAARVYRNGFSTLQRANGGAGTDKVVTAGQPVLKMRTYEARWCCTMRLAEGLRCIWENQTDLYYENDDKLVRDDLGRLWGGDVIYGQVLQPEFSAVRPFLEAPLSFGKAEYYPIPKLYRIPDETGRNLQFQVLF